ncbi:MAG: hypothetical protein MUC56_05355 [Thermoanaerobaculales bacterium]|jgi:hypothetical protein|nr:hypothetical protein [Thermoanaerobaculales bacterium]
MINHGAAAWPDAVDGHNPTAAAPTTTSANAHRRRDSRETIPRPILLMAAPVQTIEITMMLILRLITLSIPAAPVNRPRFVLCGLSIRDILDAGGAATVAWTG